MWEFGKKAKFIVVVEEVEQEQQEKEKDEQDENKCTIYDIK